MQGMKTGILPGGPDDDADVIMEIEAGSGGDDAALFAAELFEMYSNYAHHQGWSVEVVSRREREPAGIREVIFRIRGLGAYGRLKYESGRHRVQRVPAYESQGRIKTSSAKVTVAPLPSHDESALVIRTYNFADDHVTDHRTKHKVAGVARILGGDVDPLIDGFTGED